MKRDQRVRLVQLVEEVVETLENHKAPKSFIKAIETEFYMARHWVPDSSGQVTLGRTRKFDITADTAVDEIFNYMKQQKQADIDLQVCTKFFLWT